MSALSPTWQIHFEVTPEWLFVRLEATDGGHAADLLTEHVWREAKQHGLNRIVLEKDKCLMFCKKRHCHNLETRLRTSDIQAARPAYLA